MVSMSDSRTQASQYPYAGHDDGIVLTQPEPGKFVERPMTAGELAARDTALAIAKDIYRHANQAGVCYYEFWELIAKAIDDEARPRWIPVADRRPPHCETVLLLVTDGPLTIGEGDSYRELGIYNATDDRWQVNEGGGDAVVKASHWAPIPPGAEDLEA